jgi:hypothetical protein
LADEDVLAAEGAALAAAIEAALPRWSVRVVTALGGPADAAQVAGREAAAAIGPALRALLTADVDEQRANPLAIVRTAVAWPTAVLRDAGVPPVERDDYDRAHFPDDIYGLTPRTFGDIDESLHEPGIRWGAMKAHVHVRRHRA